MALRRMGFRPHGLNGSRTRFAGQYAPLLCRAWARVLQAAFAGWSPGRLQGKLEAARAGECLAEGPLSSSSARR